MQFMVSRASSGGNSKPCSEAKWLPYDRVDVRKVEQISKMDWDSEGRDHVIVDGKAKRVFDAKAWFLDLDTFEDLKEFMEIERESVIISKTEEGFLKLVIYDDYVE